MNEKVLEQEKDFFWLKSGKGLRSLRELADVFPNLSEEEFAHHVDAEKNDFTDWIAHLFGEYRLSEKLRQTRSKADFQSILYNYIIQREHSNKSGNHSQDERQNLESQDERVIKDPQEFVHYHEQDSEKKDKTADRFDAMATRFEESLNPETPETVEKRIESLEERNKELHRKITEARKEGKDPLIADFTLRPVVSKIAYARISHQEKDFQVVERILAEAEKELEEALAFEEPNVKKEVEALVKAGQATQTPNIQAGGTS